MPPSQPQPQPQTPIQLTIPPTLAPLTIPLSTYLATHTSVHTKKPYTNLAVGALVFHPPRPSPNTRTKLLLLRRAPTESAFPNLWEVPGGSSDATDPTVLHSLVREVFEETGMRVTRFLRGVGRGVEFVTPGRKEEERRWMKLSFEVEVLEIHGGSGHMYGEKDNVAGDGDGDGDGDGEIDVEITLDPEEHSEYVWATEQDIRGDRYSIVTPEQKEIMLEGFKLRTGDSERVKALVDGSKKS
ncbi:hypothetical protein N7G274_006940 [Stereocaulon virgatum]|uniref:Nudix hydrolase domain-containing protein n=1 Tax=Stereocaulon virgatum TaxID=373712 RepID=A0ABR4A3J8_9LECA